MKRVIVFLLLFAANVWPALAQAEEVVNQSQSATLLFQSGMEASKRGAYDQALEHFSAARAAGMAKPALHYNIGVCYYKLEKYQEAEEAFRKTAESPAMAALAHYNLGLIFLKKSDTDKAAYWFRRAYEDSKNEKLRLMATNALDRLNGKNGQDVWAQYASLGLGYDDNVELLAQTETLQTSGQGDFFTEVFGHISGPLGRSQVGSGFHVNMNAYLLHYFDMEDYDIGSVSLGLLYKEKVNTFQLEGGGEYAYTFLDNQSFEQTPTMSLQVKYPLQAISSLLRFRYRLSYLDILDDDYEYLTGWRHQALAESSWNWSRYSALLEYVLEMNDRDNPDYSPTRHSLTGVFCFRPYEGLQVALEGGYRKSEYDINNSVNRDEERFRADVRVSFYLKKGWEINGEYQYTDNDSNFEEYNYTSNMVVLSVGRIF